MDKEKMESETHEINIQITTYSKPIEKQPVLRKMVVQVDGVTYLIEEVEAKQRLTQSGIAGVVNLLVAKLERGKFELLDYPTCTRGERIDAYYKKLRTKDTYRGGWIEKGSPKSESLDEKVKRIVLQVIAGAQEKAQDAIL